jgi:hypothetical protein
MAQLFKSQFLSFLSKRVSHDSSPTSLAKLAKAYLPRGSHNVLLHRFPRTELRHIAKMECATSQNRETVSSMKKLREDFKIKEEGVCASCSKREGCKVRGLSHTEMVMK